MRKLGRLVSIAVMLITLSLTTITNNHTVMAQEPTQVDHQDDFDASLDFAQKLDAGWLTYLHQEMPCPCSLDEVDFDTWGNDPAMYIDALDYFHPGAETSVRSDSAMNLSYARFTPGQQCTYDSQKRLIVGGAGAGTPDLWSPGFFGNDNHDIYDVDTFKILGWKIYSLYWRPDQGDNCQPNQVTTVTPPITLNTVSIGSSIVEDASLPIQRLPDAQVGKPYSHPITINGLSLPFELEVTGGELPPGLNLSDENLFVSRVFKIAGIPEIPTESTNQTIVYTFTITVDENFEAYGLSGSQVYEIAVLPVSETVEGLCLPSANGCGPEYPDPIPNSFGFYDFENACNNHDICYGTPGNTKETCDNAFAYDLLSECELVENGAIQTLCRSDADLYIAAVNTFGEGFYEDAQELALQCKSGVEIIEGAPAEEITADILDIMFVIDTTGSMADDIDEVKRRAIEIINQVASTGSNWQIGIVTYRDHPEAPYGEPSDYLSRIERTFSADQNSIVAAINGIVVGGGGDPKEAVYAGLLEAIAQPWRNGARKVIILMGDAPPQEPDPKLGYTAQTVLQAAYDVDPASIFPILIESENAVRFPFQVLADGSSGRLFYAANAQEVVPTILSTIDIATGVQLAIGLEVQIASLEPAFPIRTSPTMLASIVTTILRSEHATIVEGPEIVFDPLNGDIPQNFIWWKVRTENGTEGWMQETYYGEPILVPLNDTDPVTPVVCTLTTIRDVNIRSGPGTNYQQIASRKGEGQILAANGQFGNINSPDAHWWQLIEGFWIRNDQVRESGNCPTLPVITSP